MTYFRLVFLGCCLLLMGCSKLPSMRCIPNDVFYASRMNALRGTYQIQEWKQVLKKELDIDLTRDSIPKMLAIKSGLGSGKSFIFGNILQNEQNYTAVSVLLFSKKRFDKFLKGINPNLHLETFKEYAFTVRNRSMLAWNKKHILYLNSPHTENENQLRELFKRLVTLKKSEMLVETRENFTKAIKNDRDLSTWVNIPKLGEIPKVKEWIENINLKDNHLNIQANFDDGSVSLFVQYLTNPKLFEDYKILLSGSVSKTLLSHLPLQKPAMMVGIGIKPEGLKQFLKDIKLTQKAENLISSVTITFEQFISMFSGDVVVALKDIEGLAHLLPPDSVLEAKHTSDMVMGIGIKNKTVYENLKKNLLEAGALEDKKDHALFFGEIYVLERDTMVYFTKNEAVKDDFLKNMKLDNPKLLEYVSDNWFFLHADEKIAMKALEGNSLFKEAARNLLKKEELKLETATIQIANKRKKDKGNAEALLLLKNSTANSLVAMIEVLKEIVFQTKMRLDPNHPRNTPKVNKK